MANNNNIGKKGGPQSALNQAAKAAESVVSPKPNNLFSRHGNQQIAEVIQSAQMEKQGSQSLLAGLEQEAEQGVEKAPSWADEKEEEAQVAKAPEEHEEKAAAHSAKKKPANAMAAAMLTEQANPLQTVSDKELQGLVAKDSEAEAMLSGADDKQLEEVKKVRQASNTTLTESAVMLAMAEGKGLGEEQKAEILLASGKEVELESLKGESGELRTLVVAEQLPPELAGFARDAATEASDSPLSERDTMKNLMDQILTISQQLGNYSELTNPDLSIDEKASKLVEIVAYELDIPTRESVSSHPFEALLEDMIFDPAGMMSVNRLAGNRRDVRTMGSFAVVLWQLSRDALQGQLENMDDKQQINEKDLLAQTYRDLSRDMFTKAMSKPSGA